MSASRITPAFHLVFVAGVLPRLVLLYRPAEGERDAGLVRGWRGSLIHTLPLWLGKSCLMWYFVLRQIVCPQSKTDLKKLKLRHDLRQIKVWTHLCVLGGTEARSAVMNIVLRCYLTLWDVSGCSGWLSTVWWFGFVPKRWICLTEPHQDVANFHPHALQVTLLHYVFVRVPPDVGLFSNVLRRPQTHPGDHHRGGKTTRLSPHSVEPAFIRPHHPVHPQMEDCECHFQFEIPF